MTLIKLIPGHCTLCHVKGHQDNHSPYGSLPIKAHMNIDADRLATEVDLVNTGPLTAVSLLPNTVAHLHVNNHIIMANYCSVLQKLLLLLTIQHHIQTKENWSNQQMNIIDWATHGHIFCKHYNNRNFFTKLTHNWPPMGSYRTQCNPYHPPKCPT